MNYTLAITSADRFDLLERSFKSFMEAADVPPSAIVIINDGPAEMPEFLKAYRHIPTTWLTNDQRRGQVHSLDRLYREVKTPYVMHLEDDFEFTGGDFIRKSFAILEKYPRIALMALRTDWHHPIADGDPEYNDFKIAMPYWRAVWGGYTWNPGIRRLADVKKFGPVAKYGKQNGLEHEALLSKAYLDSGYRIAIGPKVCHHIGEGRSKASEKIEIKEPKILIAVPACHRYSYGKWESENSPLFDRSKAYRGEAYGTDIHISNASNDRIEAVRDTWLTQANKLPNVTARFFYGNGGTRDPLADEVFLKVEDDYEHLPHKTIAVVKYALDHGYDYLFKCDDDTYVWPDRLIEELRHSSFDYAGYQHGNVCTGGPGYFLSRRAMEAVQSQPFTWCEDVNVARCMHYAGISPEMLTDHYSGQSNHFFDIENIPHGAVAIHAVKPEDIRKIYTRENS
jgi:Galactosyltransferase